MTSSGLSLTRLSERGGMRNSRSRRRFWWFAMCGKSTKERWIKLGNGLWWYTTGRDPCWRFKRKVLFTRRHGDLSNPWIFPTLEEAEA